MPKLDFGMPLLHDPEQEMDDDLSTLNPLSSRFDPYSEKEIELTTEEAEELGQLNFENILQIALADRELVD